MLVQLMKELNLSRTGPKLVTKSLSNLVAAIHSDLPVDYVDFLRRNNGGDATDHFFKFKRRKRYINNFLATIQSKAGPLTILGVRTQCDGFIPTDSVPIAFIDGSNLLLIRTKPRRFGAIDLKLDAETWNCDDPESGVFKVAPSFAAFLERVDYMDPSDLDDDEYGLW